MIYTKKYSSPLGGILLAADDNVWGDCESAGKEKRMRENVCLGGWRCCWSQSNINRHPVLHIDG